MIPPEINIAVARKLGWIDVGQEPGQSWISGISPELQSQRSMMHIEIPDYCGSIAAAWEILDKLAKENERKGCGPILSVEHDGRWHCRLGPMALTLDDPNVAQADTAPMAICLAFLKLQTTEDLTKKSI